MKNIVYIARNNGRLFPGVQKKIEQTVASLNEVGNKAECLIIDSNPKFKSIKKYFEAIFFSKAEIIILRNDVSMPLFFLPMLWQRLRGCKIIIDVPTPLTVVLREIDGGAAKWLKKITRKTMMMVAFPWSLWPANKIIQYAPESRYFSFGIENKIQLSANGIAVDQIRPRRRVPDWPSNSFVMIGVASLADWHAFDRVIRGMGNYLKNNNNTSLRPKFIIVGDGEVRQKWQKLALDLGLKEFVLFVGYKNGEELDVLFEEAHVAISSLGLGRINLKMASVLKSREYAARGIPFLRSGHDIDFNPNPNFAFEVENSDDPILLDDLIWWYGKISHNKEYFEDIRVFAEKNLDFSKKVKELIF